ncbi:unnamed protein product [Cochlearia groenlandica]
MFHETWFRALETSFRQTCTKLIEKLIDAIVTEPSDEETEYEPVPGNRSADRKLPGARSSGTEQQSSGTEEMPSTRSSGTEETPSTRLSGIEQMPSTRSSNTEEKPNVSEGVITRSRAKDLARKAHTMIQEEKLEGADTRSYFNVFTTTT